MKNIELYRTQDFEKALLLFSSGCFLEGVEWDQHKNVATFAFEDKESCESVLSDHRKGKLKLGSKDTLYAYRTLKKELRNGQ